MYSVQCTVCNVQCVQCTVFNVHCTMYTVQCTLCNVQCAMYSVQCTVFNVQYAMKSHFDSEEHIKLFHSVCDIEIKKSFQKAFIPIKCQFYDIRYNYIYTDLYFKKHVKDIILKILMIQNIINLTLSKKIC